MLLDDVMPRSHKAEWHQIRLTADGATVGSAGVWAAVEELTWGEVPVFRALVRLRALRRGRLPVGEPVLDTFRAVGFVELGRAADEVVFGTVARAGGPPVGLTDAAAFARFDEPGHVKIAMNFRYADGVLGTQTRVFATDRVARRRFAVYWFLIRPFSGLIRRIWLRAIVRRCRRAAPAAAS